MNEVFIYASNLIILTIKTVGRTLLHNWYVLGFAILTAVALKTYVNSDKLSAALMKRKKVSILASVAFGAFTPLCACGTTAVIVGMMSTTLPWGPIMAFLTSSPLMSPDGFVLISGVISLKFAIALTVASVAIGLTAGFITNIIEKRTNILANQNRFAGNTPVPSCSCNVSSEAASKVISTQAIAPSCSCSTLNEEKEAIEMLRCSCSAVNEKNKLIEISECSCNTVNEKNKPIEISECSCSTEKVEKEAVKVSGCSCSAENVEKEAVKVPGCSCGIANEAKEDLKVSRCSCNAAEFNDVKVVNIKNTEAPVITTACCGTLALAGEGVGRSASIVTNLYGNHRIDFESKTQYCCEQKERISTKLVKKLKLRVFASNLYTLGFKQILVFYSIFVAVGYMINYFIPSSIITLLFGAHAFYAVPLASLIGLPLYITTDSGIPIIQSMLASGASEGAMMAFIITGSATSAWVIAGLSTFMKKRALLLYVAFVLAGGILSGYILDFVNLFF